MATPDFSNLQRATEDVAAAASDPNKGPADPRDYDKLRQRLATARAKLPPLYRQSVFDPFDAELTRLGKTGFNTVLARDVNNEGEGRLMLDIAQAILQQADNYEQKATDAYQEVISDLYDGFLSAEDRRGVKPPDKSVIAPLVKWGEPDSGPYTWPMDATASFGLQTSIVSMPPGNASRGLLSWAALGHETAGHDIMGADTGLEIEMQETVHAALMKAKMGSAMADYWAERIDETASDVMGILNIGPVTAISLIAFLRGFVGGALRNKGSRNDPHPADMVRGYLGAEVVRLLKFKGRTAWANAIIKETDKDLKQIVLAGEAITRAKAIKSAKVVARALVLTPMVALENHHLGEIQNWADHDEAITAQLKALILGTGNITGSLPANSYAAHAVAAGCMATMGNTGTVKSIFNRTIDVLKAMHDANPSWGPLFVAHPGDFGRHLAVQR